MLEVEEDVEVLDVLEPLDPVPTTENWRVCQAQV